MKFVNILFSITLSWGALLSEGIFTEHSGESEHSISLRHLAGRETGEQEVTSSLKRGPDANATGREPNVSPPPKKILRPNPPQTSGTSSRGFPITRRYSV